jgi:hypothetical protein
MNEPISSEPAGEEVDPSVVPTEVLLCPRCQSERIETRSYGKKIGGALGALAGLGSGVALVLSGADIRNAGGSAADPSLDAAVDGLVGGVLAVLKSGSAGCTAGADFGNVIDEHVLDRHRCVECGHAFSQPYVST